MSTPNLKTPWDAALRLIQESADHTARQQRIRTWIAFVGVLIYAAFVLWVMFGGLKA